MMSPQAPPGTSNGADPLTVVERYLDALTAHDHDAIAGLIAPAGFRYETPIATIADTGAFLEYILMTGGILRGIERLQTFVDGNHVCHWLVFETQLSERISTRAAHWATVEEGRITRIELLFDPYRWRMLFESAG
jgi:hypothetical protein